MPPAMSKAKRPAAEGNNNNEADDNSDNNEEIPYVQVDGVRYYSDRFYLNRTAVDDPINANEPGGVSTSSSSSQSSSPSSCTCGARNPPPLLDRSRLVASLKLKAAILATYTLEPDTVMSEFPCLFHANTNVPVLILHGQKGWTPACDNDDDDNRRTEKKHDDDNHDDHDDNDDDDRDEETPPPPIHLNTNDGDADADDDCSVGTQEEATLQAADNFKSPETPIRKDGIVSSVQTEDAKDLDSHSNSPPPPPLPYKSRATFGDKDIARFPDHVHWTEVLPSWIPPHDLPSQGGGGGTGTTNEDGTISLAVQEKRRMKRGVHHCKFMILLETSGSMVVVVSTSNLSRSLATDGSWVQRFPATTAKSTTTATTATAANKTDGSDFGAVLANMLQCQTWASQKEQLTPVGFVRRYLGWKNLRHLERNFDYSQSQVHLVATVPGDQEGRLSRHHNHASQSEARPEHFYYGRQRVAHLLKELSGSRQPWLPPILLHKEDRLVFQPTSFGADWNRSNMSEMVRSYLGLDEDPGTDQNLLERLDIVWPTGDFMHEVLGSVKGRQSPDSVSAAEAGFLPAAQQLETDTLKEEEANKGFIFLSSETFNKIDLSCLSQMVMYEPSVPSQHPLTLPPHFKSVVRLCEGNDYRLRKDYGFKKCEENFSWFLLTSACLSRGAQGEADANRRPGSDAVSYSNFELGVLFCSRLQGRKKTDRLYCWKPAQCTCGRSTAGGPSLIHLPVPYCFRPSRYQEDEDDVEFCETPYFHEIPPGTGCIGHMKLTPYGAALAAKHA
jgi:hypothetical protein